MYNKLIGHKTKRRNQLEFNIENEPSDSVLSKIENELMMSQDVDLNNSLRSYLRDIGQVKLLTKDEEVELAKAISLANGSMDHEIIKEGKNARDKLILANLRLVVSIAKKYSYSNLEIMDLIQDGTMGLMKAVDRYQVERGFRFSTYATWWIRQSISRSISDTSRTIRLPVYIHEMLSYVRKIKRHYINEHGVEPDIETISRISGIPIQTLKLINMYDLNTLSIDQPISDDGTTLAEIAEDKDNPDPDKYYKILIFEEYVNEILEELSKREREIIKMRFGIGTEEKTLNEIGRILGITRERVRQIQTKAMEKIRKMLTTKQ